MTSIRWVPNWFEPHRAERIHVDPDSAGRIALRQALPGCAPGADLAAWRNGTPVDVDGPDGIVMAADADGFVVVARPRGPVVGAIVLQLAISFFAGVILARLLKPPEQPDDTGDDGPTYGFDGLSEQRKEGRPQQMIYGRHRAAGTIINEGIECRPESHRPPMYFAQIAYGSGPVRAIGDQTVETAAGSELMTSVPTRTQPGGVYLDGNSIENVPGVVASVKLGNINQEYARGFDLVERSLTIGRELTSPELLTTTGGDYDKKNPLVPIIDPLSDSQSDQDAYWDNRGVIVETQDEADWARVTLRFTRGYFTTNDSVPASRAWSHIIRYIELDADGNPITTGGDFGDGYVRLPYYLDQHRNQTLFTIDHQFPLLNPRTYTTPSSAGASLWANGTGVSTDCVVSSPSVPWSDGAPLAAFTVSAWVNVRNVTTEEEPWTVVYQKSRTVGGFALRFSETTYTSGPSTQSTVWVPTFEMVGSNLSGGVFFENWQDTTEEPRFSLHDPDETTFEEAHTWRKHHVVVTYLDRASIDDENDRIRLYVDGELIEEYLGNIQFSGSTAALHIGRDPTEPRPIHGGIDEVWIAHTELSAEDVKRAYGNGSGLRGAIGSVTDERLYHIFEAADLVAGYHFDGDSDSFDTAYGNDATTAGAFTTDGQWLVPLYPSAAEIRRARYRVEVARNIETTTHIESFDDGVDLERLTWAIEQRQQNPGVAVLSLRVAASEAVNGQVPPITSDIDGRLCKVWDGVDASSPNFVDQWTRNPAWVVCDIALRDRLGLGDQFTASNIDATSFQAWADYCDEVIYDLRGNRIYGDESSETTTPAVTRMKYDATVSGEPDFDGRGRIQVFLDGPPPANWAVGRFVSWSAEATASGFVNHNTDPDVTGGYEIANMTPSGSGSAWVVAVYWDRISEGSPWTSGTFLDLESGLSFSPYRGLYECRLRRHTWDAVHDTAEEVWDVIQEVASVGRSIVYFDGTKLRAKVSQERDPVGVVSFGSIIEDSFEVEYSNPRERPNAYTIEFLDEDNGWNRSSAFVDHESAASAQGTVELDQDGIFVRGITRRSAARRHAKFLVNVNQEVIRSGQFRASVDALHYEPGDVLVLQHDLLPWGLGGRTSADSTLTTELVLDREVTVGASGTYYVDVSDPNANGFHTALIADGAGDYTTVTLDSGLPFIPSADLRYVFYEEDERKLIEVSSIRLAPDMTAEVEWVEYVTAIYDDVPTDESESPVAAAVDTWGTQDEVDIWATQDLADTWGQQA